MAGSSNAEDFIIKLHEQVSPAAKVAESAIAQLEARIASQKAALAGYEAQLAAAAEKLRTLGEGDERGAVNVAAFRRQQQVMAALQSKIDETKGALDRLGGAQPLASTVASFQKAENAIKQAAHALQELEAKQALLAAGGGANKAQVDAMTAAIQRQRAAVLQAQQAYVKMGGTAQKALEAGGGKFFGQVGEEAKSARLNLNELSEAFGRLGGPIGAAGQKVTALGGAFQKLGAIGPALIIVAIVAVVVALAAALAYAAVQAVRFAVSMADAARNQRLTLEGLANSSSRLAGIQTILPRVAEKTGATTEALQGMAAELAKLKVPAQNMGTALEALATATEGGATPEFLEKLKKGLENTGKVPKDLAAQMSVFESIVARKLLGLDKQSEKFKKNFGALFRDINIEPLLQGLQKLVALFDSSEEKGTAMGRTLKWAFESIFQPIIDGVTKAIPVIEAFLLGLAIGALKVYIAFKPAIRAVKELFGGEKDSSLEDTLNSAAKAGEYLAIAMVAMAAVVTVVLAGLAVSAFTLALPFILLPALIVAAFMYLPDALSGAWDSVSEFVSNAYDAGAEVVNGIAEGITAGAEAVLEAITGVVQGGIDAAKELLGIASPSKVFRAIGANTGRGMAEGVASQTPLVQEALTEMALPRAAANDTSSSSAPRDGGGRELRIEFNNCTFGGDAGEEQHRAWVTKLLHEEALAG